MNRSVIIFALNPRTGPVVQQVFVPNVVEHSLKLVIDVI
jgi:hypothetical protein